MLKKGNNEEARFSCKCDKRLRCNERLTTTLLMTNILDTEARDRKLPRRNLTIIYMNRGQSVDGVTIPQVMCKRAEARDRKLPRWNLTIIYIDRAQSFDGVTIPQVMCKRVGSSPTAVPVEYGKGSVCGLQGKECEYL